MQNYDDNLRQLAQQVARARQLKVRFEELDRQYQDLSQRAGTLKKAMNKEQADVDRLERGSLATFFYQVVGKMDEKLDKERQEAYAARVKYDAVARELDAVKADLDRISAELGTLQGCEEAYQKALQEKAAAVKAAGGPNAEEILALEERIAWLESQRLELSEAISAGTVALDTAQRILNSLNSAEGWGTWDLLGGGMLADMAKYSHLDDAQAELERLQGQLRQFKTELADVQLQADLQINVDSFLRFADYFFDNLFTDWTVLEQIHNSQAQVQDTCHTIEQVLRHLDSLGLDAAREQEQLRAKLDELVLQASL